MEPRTSRNLEAPARPHTAMQSLSGKSGSPMPSITGTQQLSAAPLASPLASAFLQHSLRQSSAADLWSPRLQSQRNVSP